MLSIAWSTVRIRWTSFAGAFVALALGSTLISMMALALAATIGGSQDLVQAQSMAATTAAITVCVAVFIVIATFAFAVEQRTRELALFRLVGATPRQIRRMVLAESALIGAAAAVVGCAGGCLGASILNRWMIAHGVAPAWFRIEVNPVALVVAFLLSVAAALIGAATVVWRASRVRPAAALREAAATRRAMTPLRWVLGLGLLAAAVITGYTIAKSDPEYVTNPRKYAMVPLLYVGGCALLAPVLLRPVARIVTWPLGRGGAGPLLVRQNVLNARRRTASTVTPAVVAIGLVAAMMCLQDAGAGAKVAQVTETAHAGMVVLPAGTDGLATAGGPTLTSSAVAAVGALPGVTATPVAYVPIQIGLGRQVIDSLTGQAVTPAAMGTTLTPRVLSGSLADLGRDYLIVDERTAREDGLILGQNLTVWLPDGARTSARVAAIIQTGLAGDDTYISAGLADHARPALIWLTLPAGTAAAAVTRELAGRGIRALTSGEYVAGLGAQIQTESSTAATVILGISVGYALLAIANTMIMAAASRRRELAAMGLAGATKAQVVGVVGGEALIAVIVAALLAAPIAAAEILTQRLALTRLVAQVPAGVPWTDIWHTVALCVLVGVAFALLAAWHATRGRAVEAIAARE
jgi:putative ABC transport system permease protein